MRAAMRNRKRPGVDAPGAARPLMVALLAVALAALVFRRRSRRAVLSSWDPAGIGERSRTGEAEEWVDLSSAGRAPGAAKAVAGTPES